MTILSDLVRLYERLERNGEAPTLGYSKEKIGYAIPLDASGSIAGRPVDLRIASDRGRSRAALHDVPAAVKRSSGIKPNFLWDKCAYALGLIAEEHINEAGERVLVPSQGKRTQSEHVAFVEMHQSKLDGLSDPGFRALLNFLELWEPDPEKFPQDWPLDLLEHNVVFEFDGRFIHDRPGVTELLSSKGDAIDSCCLVTGKKGPIARIHPSISGVVGAQSFGAALVSFNDEAYESLGKKQGNNAPVSNYAAFAYGSALNTLLLRNNTIELDRCFRVGDVTFVFWVDADSEEHARSCERWINKSFNSSSVSEEALETRRAFRRFGQGGCLDGLGKAEKAQVFILGISPNTARLSIQLWHSCNFREFAESMTRFWDGLSIYPSPWIGAPGIRLLFSEVAVQRKLEDTPTSLAIAVVRSILGGQPLPASLLGTVLARIRADGDEKGRRASLCQAVILSRKPEQDVPSQLDKECAYVSYHLGRLFALIERIQLIARPGSKTTLAQFQIGRAFSSPASTFPHLLRQASHQLSLMKRWNKPFLALWAEEQLDEILEQVGAGLPRSLCPIDQGRFMIGYHHQRWAKRDEERELMHTGSEAIRK